MYFPYKYLAHNITRLQEWADFTFVNVWCNAKENIEYDFSLFDECPDFKDVLKREEYKCDEEVEEKDYITGPVQAIYKEFQKLSTKQKTDLKRKYINSRSIEKICSNSPNFKPFNILSVEKHSKNLAKLLKTFYLDLYNNGLKLSSIYNNNGKITDHYRDFTLLNRKSICPFCGVQPFRTHEMYGHEAYDHYFPKEHYPFYSVHFKNLVLSCHDCNSTHKKGQIPIYKKLIISGKNKYIKRKAFYPYGFFDNRIDIKVSVNFTDYKNYSHSDIDIVLKSKGKWEENRTWQEIYNLKTRYKDLLVNDSLGKTWLTDFFDVYTEKIRESELEKFELIKKDKQRYGQDMLRASFILAYNESK